MACVSSIANGFEVWTQTFTVPGQSTDVDEAQLGLVAQLNRFFAVNNSVTLVTLSVFSDAKATPDGGQPQYGVRLLLLSGGTQYNAREFDDPAAFEAYTAANPSVWPVHVFNLVPIGVATSLRKLVGIFADRDSLHLRSRQPQVIPALADEVVAFFDDGAFEVDVPQNLTQVIRGVNLGNADWPLGGNAPMVKTPLKNSWAGIAPCAYAGAGPSEVQPLPDCDFLNNCCGDLEPLSGSTGIIRNCTTCQDPDTPGEPLAPSAPLSCDWDRTRWSDDFSNEFASLRENVPVVARKGNLVAIVGADFDASPDQRIVRYSTDGVTWSDSLVDIHTLSGSDSFIYYDEVNGWWVIYETRYITAYTNTNATPAGSWSPIDLSGLAGTSAFDNSLWFCGNRYFLFPSSPSISGSPPYLFYTSLDLISWQVCSVPDDINFYNAKGVVFLDGFWYALAAGNLVAEQRIWKSSDGVAWSELPLPNLDTFWNVIGAGPGKLMLIQSRSTTGLVVFTSTDGALTWSSIELFNDGFVDYKPEFLRYLDGYYILGIPEFSTTFGSNFTSLIYTSADGVTWERCDCEAGPIDVTRIPSVDRWLIPGVRVFTSTDNQLAYKTGS